MFISEYSVLSDIESTLFVTCLLYFSEEKSRKTFGCLNANMNLVIELEKSIFHKVPLALLISFTQKERHFGADPHRIETSELYIAAV